MKRGILFVIIIMLVITSIIYTFAGIDNKPADLDSKKLERMNIKLDEPSDKSMFTENGEKAAILAAKKETNQTDESNENVKVKRCLVTNSSTQIFSETALEKNPRLKEKGYMDKIPAYIVSFKTEEFYGFGLDTGNRKPFTEYHVIIDAVSGEVLMSFAYN